MARKRTLRWAVMCWGHNGWYESLGTRDEGKATRKALALRLTHPELRAYVIDTWTTPKPLPRNEWAAQVAKEVG